MCMAAVKALRVPLSVHATAVKEQAGCVIMQKVRCSNYNCGAPETSNHITDPYAKAAR